MFRERKEEGPKIHFSFPIFDWECCEFCDREFRYERGYYTRAYPSRRKSADKRWYICHQCAPTKECVVELVTNKIKEIEDFIKNYRPDAPPPPPPPPPKRVIVEGVSIPSMRSPYDASRAPGLRKSPRRKSSPYDCSSLKS